MKRFIFISLGACLSLFVLFSFAQKTKSIPQNVPDSDTVYYLQGESLYHAKTCPDLVGKNGWAASAWTLRWRDMKPCPKCLYKEIVEATAPAKAASAKADVATSASSSIARWEGSSIKNTETFTVNTAEWIIKWQTTGEGNFIINVMNADTDEMKDMVANIIGSGNDSSVIRGKGRYYLRIIASQPYKIEVLEKK